MKTLYFSDIDDPYNRKVVTLDETDGLYIAYEFQPYDIQSDEDEHIDEWVHDYDSGASLTAKELKEIVGCLKERGRAL